MSLVSLQADINDKRLENGAAVVFEDQYPVRKRQALSRYDPNLTAAAKFLNMAPEELFELRKWVRRVTDECTERLLREMAVVYTLNEPRDRVIEREYITKMQASDKYPIAGGDLLDLDRMYGGMLVRARQIYLSEAKFEQGLLRYGSVEILNGLLAESCAA